MAVEASTDFFTIVMCSWSRNVKIDYCYYIAIGHFWPWETFFLSIPIEKKGKSDRCIHIYICTIYKEHPHVHIRHDLDGRVVCSLNSDDDDDDDVDDDEGK